MNILTNPMPEVNFESTLHFLEIFEPDSAIAICAMEPDGGPVKGGVAQISKDREATLRLLEEYAHTCGLFFHPNAPATGKNGKRGKLAKTDIGLLRAVYVDIDQGPGRTREDLLELAAEWAVHLEFPPTAIVDTGNGIQMLWRLREPLECTDAAREAVEAQGAGLADYFHADAVQNVDRLLRLPGTINWPSKGKRERGRVPVPAKLFHMAPANCYLLEDLARLAAPREAGKSAEASVEGFDYGQVIAVAEAAMAARDAEDAGDRPAQLAAQLAALAALLPSHLATLARQLSERPAVATLLEDCDTQGKRSNVDFGVFRNVIEAGLSDATQVGSVAFGLSPYRLCEQEDKGGGLGEYYALHTVEKALARVNPAVAPLPGDFFQIEVGDGEPNLKPKRRLALHTVRTLEDPAELPVRGHIIWPTLPVGDVFQLVGEPGVSKSTLALHYALAVATGSEKILRGVGADGKPISLERLHRSGSVVIYNVEDRLDEMRRRLRTGFLFHGVTASKHEIHLSSGVEGESLVILHRRGGGEHRAPERAPGADMLEEVLREHKPALVVLDTQVSLGSGMNENSNDDMNALLQELARIAARHAACIMVVHHTSKATRDNRGDMGAGRGAFAAVGKVRVAATLCRADGDGEEALWRAAYPRQQIIRLDFSKVSHGRKPAEPIVFCVHEFGVGNGAGPAIPRDAAEFFFDDDDPREALRLRGDMAPVLELIDHRTLSANAGARPRDNAKAEAIARIVSDLMGDVEAIKLADVRDAIGVRMRERGAPLANARNSFTGEIVAALSGGVTFPEGEQNVTLRIAKLKAAPTAPWWIERSREPAT